MSRSSAGRQSETGEGCQNPSSGLGAWAPRCMSRYYSTWYLFPWSLPRNNTIPLVLPHPYHSTKYQQSRPPPTSHLPQQTPFRKTARPEPGLAVFTSRCMHVANCRLISAGLAGQGKSKRWQVVVGRRAAQRPTCSVDFAFFFFLNSFLVRSSRPLVRARFLMRRRRGEGVRF